jgi:hypothetical protein
MANAAGGCGPGFHRGPYGECVPNRAVVVASGPVVVAPAPVVVAPPVVVVPAAACALLDFFGGTDAAARSEAAPRISREPADDTDVNADSEAGLTSGPLSRA